MAAQILGGGFSSRLLRRIRTELGWAYNIGASWDANYDHPGVFRISGSTQSVHTVDTLKAVREELEKFRSAEVSDEELKTAKDTVLNGFVFHFDRPSKTLNRLVLYEYFGYPRDFLFQYQKAIAAVTKADILRVAQKYFKLPELTLCRGRQSKGFWNAAHRAGHCRFKISISPSLSLSRKLRRLIRPAFKKARICCSACSRRWAARTNWPP